MSASKEMTLRVQTAEGTCRVEVGGAEATARLYERVHEALRLASFAFALHKDRARKEEIVSSKSRTLNDYGLQHGDMLYLSPVNGARLFDQTNNEEMPSAPQGESSRAVGAGSTVSQTLPPELQEDDVDIELYKESGAIERPKDDKLCRHNNNGRCVHCSPLEPWDEAYLKEHNIKHMSFHAYLRKLTSGSRIVSLEEPCCTIKPGCTEHPAWPRGICSGCQPAPVTLCRQPYRHVDNVLLEHPGMAERFLAYWRASGHQRRAELLGRYERHRAAPLAIRARVCAIYEPPQESSRDEIRLCAGAGAAGGAGGAGGAGAAAAALAAALGLRRVGWIFTDLLPKHDDPQKVECIRGAESHFLSAQECLTAAALQDEHRNVCRHAADRHFGSKFVTVCVTGDEHNAVHLEGYQVSAQLCALQRAGALVPTRDAPDLAALRRADQRAYVPDVYYKERDAYGNEVSVATQRIPVAYALVDVPVGVAGAGAGGGAEGEAPLFSPAARFPPAHRPLHAHLQTLQALHQHLQESSNFLEAMSDFHVLLYLMTNETLAIELESLRPLLEAVRARDAAAAERWRAGCGAWGTLERVAAAAGAGAGAAGAGAGAGGELWTCPHCTFHNAPQHTSCDMCALPRGDAM